MAKIMVTGGLGFVGSNLSHHYAQQGHEVIIVDNFTLHGNEINWFWLREQHGDRVQLVPADIRQAAQLQMVFRAHIDLVLVAHCAAQVSSVASISHPRYDFEVNALGTLNLLESVRTLTPQAVFLYTSTNQVYGDLPHLRVEETPTRYLWPDLPQGITEDFPLAPLTPYGCSKTTGDVYTQDYHRIYGLKTVVMRLGGIYGVRQLSAEAHGWIAFMTQMAYQDVNFNRFGTGKQVRDMLYVDDIVAAYDAAFRQIDHIAGEVFNIGGGAMNISVLELLDKLAQRLGHLVRSTINPPRPGDKKIYVCNNDKARQQLGWQPTVTIDEGLDRLLLWIEQLTR